MGERHAIVEQKEESSSLVCGVSVLFICRVEKKREINNRLHEGKKQQQKQRRKKCALTLWFLYFFARTALVVPVEHSVKPRRDAFKTVSMDAVQWGVSRISANSLVKWEHALWNAELVKTVISSARPTARWWAATVKKALVNRLVNV